MNETQRTCSVCGKKLQINNKTGFCYKHYEHSRKNRKTYAKRKEKEMKNNVSDLENLKEIALQIVEISEDWRVTKKAIELHKLICEKMIPESDRPEEK